MNYTKMPPTETIGVRLSRSEKERLCGIARAQGNAVSRVVRRLIVNHLDELERHK